MSYLLTPYPSGQDIRYAYWLKHFAAQLPDYQERYQLDVLLVLRVQCLALDFLEMLCYQSHCATAAIQQQLSACSQHEIISQLAVYKSVVQDAVAEVVAHIEQHPAYLVVDGDKLFSSCSRQLSRGPQNN